MRLLVSPLLVIFLLASPANADFTKSANGEKWVI